MANNLLLRRSTNLCAVLEASERAWLSGEINESWAESPEYSESAGRVFLRHIQASAPRLPDYELVK